jgi:hypothetical protein
VILAQFRRLAIDKLRLYIYIFLLTIVKVNCWYKMLLFQLACVLHKLASGGWRDDRPCCFACVILEGHVKHIPVVFPSLLLDS